MARQRKRRQARPAPLSEKARRVQDDKRRIARELAAVRRVHELAKRLGHAAARAEISTFQLGRELVTARDFAVVGAVYLKKLQEEHHTLSARVEELERLLADEFTRRAAESA